MSLQKSDLLQDMITNQGNDLLALSEKSKVLLVFLRHFGCIFCMEALSDISKKKKEIEATGAKIVFVHMADHDYASQYLKEFGFEHTEHISDPDCRFYNKFGLMKANFGQLFGLKVWLRTAEVSFSDSKRIQSRRIGDGHQMPGVFLIEKGKTLEQFIHTKVSDRPDYLGILDCCSNS